MAKIMFLQAEYKYQDFEAIKLSFPQKKLKKGLAACFAVAQDTVKL